MNDKSASSLEPIVVIYQNADHVAGLLQQVSGSPLVTEGQWENDTRTSRDTELNGDVDVAANARTSIPFVGGVDVDLEGSVGGKRAKAVATGSRSTQSFVYSQAYYLSALRSELRERDLLRAVASSQDVSDIRPGQFVEYTASFRPSELSAFIDVLTPDVVAAIVSWWSRKSLMQDFDEYESLDAMRRAAFKASEEAGARAQLAAEVTRAVKRDFRQDRTREYYGSVGVGASALTAVTICDESAFIVEDRDRLLDGSFTVLGKVTTGVQDDVPVLERNKLLRLLNADAVDAIFAQLRELTQTAPAKFGEVEIAKVLDFDLPSRIEGPSLKVLPIAIYS